MSHCHSERSEEPQKYLAHDRLAVIDETIEAHIGWRIK